MHNLDQVKAALISPPGRLLSVMIVMKFALENFGS